MNTPLEIAFKLLSLNYRPLPSGWGNEGKSPMLDSWEPYKQNPPTEDELLAWEKELHPLLWGITTGVNITILDVDTPQAIGIFKDAGLTPHIKTPGGQHYWCEHIPGLKNKVKIVPGVDVRNDGGFANTIGTRKDGGKYELLKMPTPDTLYKYDQLPFVIRRELEKPKTITPKVSVEGELIPPGQQDAWLTSNAGRYRRAGDTKDVIKAKLLIDMQRCPTEPGKKPYTERDAERIAESISRYEPVGTNVIAFTLTDSGNGERFAKLYGNRINYVKEWKCFIVYNGKVWIKDISGARVEAYSKNVARSIYTEAANEKDDNKRAELAKWAKQSESYQKRQAMIEALKSEDGIEISQSQLDSHDYLLNCPNGTVNLRTGELLPHDKNDLLTQITPTNYFPDLKSELWEQLLNDTYESKPEIKSFIKRSIGYSIKGDNPCGRMDLIDTKVR